MTDAELKRRLIRRIALGGPMRVSEFMALALHDPTHGYYATHPGLGADFITAPETSQMFGELIGLWCAHEWDVLGRPAPFHLVELGPGTGALMRDALRATTKIAGFHQAMRPHFVETSPALRALQREIAPHAEFHDVLETLLIGPTLLIANEFFDCLPIRQFVRDGAFWREREIGLDAAHALRFGLSPTPIDNAALPGRARAAQPGAVFEIAPTLKTDVEAIVARLKPGRALIIDYGGDGLGDTLQALRAHAKEDVLAHPGEADLTAHVDFAALAEHARGAGLHVSGPLAQGAFLKALGIDQRAEALARANPDQADKIARGHARLTHHDQMGALFKALCLSSPGLPEPAGF